MVEMIHSAFNLKPCLNPELYIAPAHYLEDYAEEYDDGAIPELKKNFDLDAPGGAASFVVQA